MTSDRGYAPFRWPRSQDRDSHCGAPVAHVRGHRRPGAPIQLDVCADRG